MPWVARWWSCTFRWSDPGGVGAPTFHAGKAGAPWILRRSRGTCPCEWVVGVGVGVLCPRHSSPLRMPWCLSAPGSYPSRLMSEDVTPPKDATGTEAPAADLRTQSDRRQKVDRRQRDEPVEVERRSGGDRRKVQRRKRRGPNQYELDPDELEFISAINEFKAQTGRPFPTWSEVLKIVRALGYRKPSS